MKKRILVLTLMGVLISCSSNQVKVKEEKKYEKEISENINFIDEISKGNYQSVLKAIKRTDYKNLSDKAIKEFVYYLGNKEKVEEDLEVLKMFLKKNRKFDFDKISDTKETFVDLLIKRGSKIDYEMIIFLKKNGYDLKYKDEKGNSYLTEAILFNFNEMSIDIIKLLLDEGLDPNEENKSHLIPLSYLLVNKYRKNDVEILNLLIDYGLDVNRTMGSEKETALMWICNSTREYVDTLLIEELLKKGANPNLTNHNTHTPLIMLILNNQIKSKSYYAAKLVEYGADLNYKDKDGMSPLLYLVGNITQKENQDLLPILTSSGANISYKDNEGNNLLVYATMYGKYDVFYRTMEFLLLAGLDPNEENNYGESSMIVAAKSDKSNYQALNLLNLFGGKVDHKDNLGNSPLSYASILYKGEREKEIIDYLVSNGADIYSENKQEYNPLMLAVLYSRKEKGIEGVETLLPYYPSPDIQCSFGYTPLMVAAQFSNQTVSLDVIDTLVDNGADINLQQEDGTTALMIAAINTTSTSNLETVKRMIELGADPKLKINKEWTDEENNVKWEVGDDAVKLAQKYMNISSSKETIDYLKSLN